MEGRIHSIETMGTVDGPGIRYVLFMQGCPMRCIFCHNRDSWDVKGGKTMDVEEIISDIKEYLPFMKFSGGGITATGGEPTLQPIFLTQLFKQVKKMGLNTALDTAGYAKVENIKELLEQTDLVLLSIKHADPIKHEQISGVKNDLILQFMAYLKQIKKPVWIRYVIIPGLTDDVQELDTLAEFLKPYTNIELIDFLPYNPMGEYKWEEMGHDYSLKNVKTPDKKTMKSVKEQFQKHGFKVNTE